MMYQDDYGDEDTRRRRRDENLSPYNPGFGTDYPDPAPPPAPAQPVKGPTADHNVNMTGNGLPPPVRPVKEATSDEHTNMTGRGLQEPPSRWEPPAPAPGAPSPAVPAHQAAVKSNAITDEVSRILMGRLNELRNPGDADNDPIFQKAVKAYQIGQLRSADRQQKALAERSAATTGTTSSGGFNVGVRGIQERAGENAAQYRSGLALDRLSAREQQLVQAIQMARAVGQDDIANQLELKRLELQQELGRGDLALRSELGRGNLNLGYDNLGMSYADMVMRANRDAVLAALGGAS